MQPDDHLAGIPPAMACVRGAIGLTRDPDVAMITIAGPGAFALVDRVCARDLVIHDGQMLQSLILDDQARIWADVEICRDRDTLELLLEGPGVADIPEVMDLLNEYRPAGQDVEIRDRSAGHRIAWLDGVYAWELMAALVGPGVLSMPHLTFFHEDGFTCYRAGRTMESGYYLVAPEDRMAGLEARVLELGERFDLGLVTVADIDLCRLEDGLLCARAPRVTRYDPIDLQQQWRVSYRKEYRGSRALLAHRQAGVTRRSVHVASDAPLVAGDALGYGGREIGTVLCAGHSAIRGQWIGQAMVERAFAYPGLDGLTVQRPGDGDGAAASIATITAPMLDNRSLYVDPMLHDYASRHGYDYPPLVMDASWVHGG